MRPGLPRSRRPWIVVALVALNALVAWAATGLYDTRITVEPDAIRAMGGRGYATDIPVPSALLRPVFDSATHPRRSPTRLTEDGKPLGPPHTALADINEQGGGRFRHGRHALYFSASDGSDPRSNNRRYEARVTVAVRPRLAVGVLLASLAFVLVLFRERTLRPLGRPFGWLYARSRVVRWLMTNVAPGLAITAVLLVLATVAGEVFTRTRVPFLRSEWPGLFDPRVGPRFVPGAEVKWTNRTDFWTATVANSLGFLDREPPQDKPAGTCRVAFFGDSFVEAAQVPIADKLQVRFEALANERLHGVRIDTVAFGYSGTGQANQLAYYDVFARPLAPDVVVLVLVSNDFANNSAELESVRHGWHPRHAPRRFYRRGVDGAFVPQPIDPDWQEHRIEVAEAQEESGSALAILRQWLLEHSYAYGWLATHLSTQYPRVFRSLLRGTRASSGLYPRRVKAIEALDGFAGTFAGWRLPDDLGLDRMFFAERMPPVFQEAEALTAHALDEWRARGERDGFRPLALATWGLSRRYGADATRHGRRLVDRGQLLRMARLLAARGIPLIDQYDYIQRVGGTTREARFQRDGHWTPQGHQWAAEALLEYFAEQPELCR